MHWPRGLACGQGARRRLHEHVPNLCCRTPRADEPGVPLSPLDCSEWLQCCSQDCGYPVVVARSDEGGVAALGSAASHGSVGFCTNVHHDGHVQRYCTSCEMFIRGENFARTNPNRGHAYGHPKRRANRK